MTIHYRKRKRVLKRILTIGILFFVTYLFCSVINIFFSHFFLLSLFSQSLVNLACAVIIVSLLFKPVDYLVFLLFRHVLFKRHGDYIYVLSKLAHHLTGVLDLEELSDLVVKTFGEAVRARTVSLMVYRQSDQVYEITSAFGINENHYRKIRFSVDQPLIDFLRTYAVPLVREQIVKAMPWQDANLLATQFDLLQSSCLIPLIHHDCLIGSLNLGTRSASKPFREADIRFFQDFAREISPSVRNAIMVEELKRVNQELRQIQGELIQSNQMSAIEQLATGLAHEIHNPLTIISGKAQVLLLKKDKKVYDEQVTDVLKTIVKQTKRAADITRKLLVFSRHQKPVRDPIAFETIIDDVIALVSYRISLDKIRVIKRLDSHLPVFYGNPSEFREIFLNLFLNAVQSVERSGFIRIDIHHLPVDNQIEIRIADTGSGIRPEHLKQVFNPFFSTRPDGAGLGLFMTQQIIRRYHGLVWVESKAGEGTTVMIQLPVPEILDNQETSKSPQQDCSEENSDMGITKQISRISHT